MFNISEWVSMLTLFYCVFLLIFKSFFAFLRWTVVAFLICLCVYLLWTDSHLQTLNAPSVSTYTVPNKISQSLTIEYSTAHSVIRNTLSICLQICSYCSWVVAIAEKSVFIFYLYTPYIVLQLYFLVLVFSLSWCNPPYCYLFCYHHIFSYFWMCSSLPYPLSLHPFLLPCSIYFFPMRRMHYLPWEFIL